MDVWSSTQAAYYMPDGAELGGIFLSLNELLRSYLIFLFFVSLL